MPSNSTDPFSANVGGLRNIGRDGRPGSGPEESQNSGAGTHTHRHGYWPRQRSRVLDWLVNETRPERFLDNIFGEFCQKLRQEGVPIARAIMRLRLHHPQWLGTRILWRPDMSAAEVHPIEYGVTETEMYRNSPVGALHGGLEQVRKRLEEPAGDQEYPVYAEMRRDGLTDYVAWPMDYTLGQRHVVSFATDRPGGFHDDELDLMADLLPALSLVTEVRFKNCFARRLLETYVGPHASEQILSGLTTRGSGVTISAVVMICDLRGFTNISELWPRDDVISMLNEYFDVISAPLERYGMAPCYYGLSMRGAGVGVSVAVGRLGAIRRARGSSLVGAYVSHSESRRLSVAGGAHHRRGSRWRLTRHPGAADRTMAI